MKRFSIVFAFVASALALAPVTSEARRPKPAPTPPPTIAATGNWADCNTVTDTRSFRRGSILTIAVTKTFTGTLNGSFSGTEYDVVHSDGSAFFYGNGLFTGSMNGKNGTFKMNYVGRSSADGSIEARWIIHDGTGELDNLVGEGSFEGDEGSPSSGCAIAANGTYRGRLIFAPPRGRR